jgi:ElaB/YqjD/DUF883 family membrane-anchored ribosome-binding protein
VSASGERSPDEIRHDIEHTRDELAQTAAALAEKADVKTRAHEKVEETKARITGKVGDAKAKVTGGGPGAASNGAQAAAGSVATKAKDNPVHTGVIAGIAAGFLLGWLIASRRNSP